MMFVKREALVDSKPKYWSVAQALSLALTLHPMTVAAQSAQPSVSPTLSQPSAEPVSGLDPGGVATRSLGSVANSYKGRVVLQFPPAGDPPPNIKPDHWETIFFPKPTAVFPGLCREAQLDVQVRSSIDVRPDQPDPPRRVTKADTVLAFRVVEPLATKQLWNREDERRTQSTCDNLSPVKGFFLLGQRLSGPAGGDLSTMQRAFRADSDIEAGKGALLLEHAIGAARSFGALPYSAICESADSTHCTDARKFLRELNMGELADIRDDHCGAFDVASRCLTILVQISGMDCALHTTPSAQSPEFARDIGIKCDERDFTRYPWYLDRLFAPTILSVE
jgi:hypothetical protein